MAGKTIYTGDMIAALESKIDTMVTALGDTVTALGDQLTALGNINTSVGQSIQGGNFAASNVVKHNIVVSEQYYTGSYIEIALTGGTFTVFGKGSVRVSGQVKGSNTDMTSCGLKYSKNGGAITTLQLVSMAGGAVYMNVTGDIPVASGDVIVLYVNKFSTGRNLYVNNVDLCFDLINVAVDGYFDFA